ncbi:MAG: SRPBCC domain-containing protein [Leadbetterella sp.]|nr:SRPBCC domain-containing protein [Leadbetterella sp.]
MNSNLLFDFSVNKENNTIHIQREFDAGLELVWKAWTTAELLDQWWGPEPWRAETKTMDFREGGSWLYAMVGPQGERHWSKAHYITIEKEKLFTQRDGFCDENGVMNAELPENIMENHFRPKGDKAQVDMILIFDDLADLEKTLETGFREGITTDFEQLDALLPVWKSQAG